MAVGECYHSPCEEAVKVAQLARKCAWGGWKGSFHCVPDTLLAVHLLLSARSKLCWHPLFDCLTDPKNSSC